MVAELRKRTKDGLLYTRRPNIQALLEGLATLSKGELVERCQIDDRASPDYVPSECLLYLVRAYRGLAADDNLDALFELLVKRLVGALPSDPPDADLESFSKGEVRESVVDRFVNLVLQDQNCYDERLDFFEVAFDSGLVKLRVTAQRKRTRVSAGLAPLEGNSGEQLSADAKSETLYQASILDVDLSNPLYRIPLQAAIDKLPVIQQRIIQLLLMGFSIDSSDPNEQTIAKALDRTEKTIRNHRDKALRALQAELQDGGD